MQRHGGVNEPVTLEITENLRQPENGGQRQAKAEMMRGPVSYTNFQFCPTDTVEPGGWELVE